MGILPRGVWRSLALAALAATGSVRSAPAQTFTPIHPPAVPLVTRIPYVNTWLQGGGDTAPGTWPEYWPGTSTMVSQGSLNSIKAITGIARIDGQTYLFLGAPTTPVPSTMTQTSLETTPTQSIFTFAGGGVTLTVDFLSPVPKELRRLSMPLTDIIATARSSDGKPHSVSVYFDISGEWASGDQTTLIDWAPETIPLNADGSRTKGSLSAWTAWPANCPPSQPAANCPVFQQANEYPLWGEVLWATEATSGLTIQSGSDTSVRGQFVANGILTGANDSNQPRAIDNNRPVFAFANALGTVPGSGKATAPFTLLLGHIRTPAIQYLTHNLSSLWTQYFSSYEAMLAFADNDTSLALDHANRLDKRIDDEARAIGGQDYAALLALSLRQTFAGTELTTAPADDTGPYMFLEEISSGNFVSTVDVVYPAMPAFLYRDPELLRYMLEPVIHYAENGYPNPFAPHDIGTWPLANGQTYGQQMPVEESAGMLIMVDAYMQQVPRAEARSFANAHYAILSQWAKYLNTTPTGVQYTNAVDPQCQLGTTDAFYTVNHSTNLALKGILGLGAMGQIAGMVGNHADAKTYGDAAAAGIAVWAKLAQNSAGTHLLLQYREAQNSYDTQADPPCLSTLNEPDSAFSLKYNAYADKLLGLNLVPKSILAEESAFYQTQENPIGIPLQTGTIKFHDNYFHPVTTAFWELWTAAGLKSPALQQALIDEVYAYANTTTSGRPFPDRYDPTGTDSDFEARPVMGGAFAPLLRGPK